MTPRTSPAAAAPGVYRLASAAGLVVYLGQAEIILGRLRQHYRDLSSQGGKYAVLRSSRPLGASWAVLEGSTERLRLEVEDDLIACAIVSAGKIPAAQFLDRGRGRG